MGSCPWKCDGRVERNGAVRDNSLIGLDVNYAADNLSVEREDGDCVARRYHAIYPWRKSAQHGRESRDRKSVRHSKFNPVDTAYSHAVVLVTVGDREKQWIVP